MDQIDTPKTPEPNGLNELAARIVQTDPLDQKALLRVMKIFKEVFPGVQGPAKPFMEEAQKVLHRMLGNDPDPRKTLSEFGRLVEQAANAGAGVASTAPTSAPSTGDVVWNFSPDMDRDMTGDFISEAREHMSSAEGLLLKLEENPEDAESIDGVFRAFHSVKGASAFLGLSFFTEMAHHIENLLSRIRDGERKYDESCADIALKSIDMVRALLDLIAAGLTGAPLLKPDGYDDLMSLLERSPSASAPTKEPPTPAPVETSMEKPAEKTKEAPAETSKKAAVQGDASVRVRTDRLDKLIDLVGELVVSHAMVTQDKSLMDDRLQALLGKVGHMDKIVRELRDLSMSLRMVPLTTTFQKMVRLGRDLGRKVSKDVELVLSGADTEIDRNMVDAVDELLVHMVRNSVDHGVESAAERKAKGKTEKGAIWLSACHAAGNVVFEIRDDGKGLDRERILKKARQQGLVREDQTPTDQEICQLIFKPGFSTAEKITDVSGRGVGMDVVRRNVETLRGTIELDSPPGQGTQVTLRLPLTLAIIQGLAVGAGGENYVIPMDNVVECLDLPRGDDNGRGAGILSLRGKPLPYVRVREVFSLDGPEPARESVVVVQSAGGFAGLAVDSLFGETQSVIKPLSKVVQGLPGVSGSAIMGDGRVALILDVPGLLRKARNEAEASRV